MFPAAGDLPMLAASHPVFAGDEKISSFEYRPYAMKQLGNIKTPRLLKKRDGKFWTLYGCYPKQGAYEIDPGYEGVASSVDGLTWKRAQEKYILSVHEPDVGDWEKHCIYQPWLVEDHGRFYNYYNAKHMPDWIEQMGLAFRVGDHLRVRERR